MAKKKTAGARGASGPVATEEKSRELLLQAGKKLFADKGLEGTTVRDIASAAGVNLSLVSYYFNGKEGLYQACIAQFAQSRLMVAERMLTPVKSREEFRLRLKMTLEELLRSQLSEPYLTCLISREIEAGLPHSRKVFEETFLKVFAAWVAFFDAAKKNDVVRKDADSVLLAQMIQGILIHFVRMDPIRSRYLKLSIRDEAYREKALDQVVELFFQGATEPESVGTK